MDAVEIARKLIVQFENISVFKITYRLPDGSTYHDVTSVISPHLAKPHGEAELITDERATRRQ
jgi:hypothetical protein